MTDREAATVQYWLNADKLYVQHTDEDTLLADAKLALDMLGAVWTRGKTDDTAGVADLLVCYKGRYIAIETKAKDGTATGSQLKFIDKVKKAGGTAMVCRSVGEVLNALIFHTV